VWDVASVEDLQRGHVLQPEAITADLGSIKRMMPPFPLAVGG
jgi:hypothetical protein